MRALALGAFLLACACETPGEALVRGLEENQRRAAESVAREEHRDASCVLRCLTQACESVEYGDPYFSCRSSCVRGCPRPDGGQ